MRYALNQRLLTTNDQLSVLLIGQFHTVHNDNTTSWRWANLRNYNRIDLEIEMVAMIGTIGTNWNVTLIL